MDIEGHNNPSTFAFLLREDNLRCEKMTSNRDDDKAGAVGGWISRGPPPIWPRGVHAPPPPLPPPSPLAEGYGPQNRIHGINIGCDNWARYMDNNVDIHLDRFNKAEAVTQVHGKLRVGCGNHSGRDNVIRVKTTDASNCHRRRR